MCRFYSYGLEQKFKPDLFQEFQSLALFDYHESQVAYGLEKLWAFLHYRKEKGGIVMDAGVEELFGGQFRSMEDFRAVRPVVSHRQGRRFSVASIASDA